MKTIAVSGVSGNVAQGVLKGLREDGGFRLVGLDISEDNAGYHLVDRGLQIDLAANPGYVDELIGVLAEERVDLYIPAVDSEVPIVAAARQAIEVGSGARVLAPDSDLVEQIVDKVDLQQLLGRWGVRTIATLHGVTDPNDVIGALGLPLVAKPRRGHGSKGVRLIRQRSELQELLAEGRADCCFQRYIAGDEYTCGLLFDCDGTLRDHIALRRKLQWGLTIEAEVVVNAALDAFIEDFGRRSGGKLQGPINLQLRMGPDCRPMVFEINPRFSGTTGLRVACGFNGPSRIARHLLLGEAITPAEVRHCRVFRYFTELTVPLENQGDAGS